MYRQGFRILVLGGLTEGEMLTELLREKHGIDTILVRAPGQAMPKNAPQGVHLVLERRGDIADLLSGVAAVVIAAHPWSSAFEQAVAETADAKGVPCLRLLRPAWRPGAGDRWTPIRDPRGAVAEILRGGYQRPFVSIGRNQIAPLSTMRGRRVFFRLPPGGALPDIAHGRILETSGEVSIASEIALFRKHNIDAVVARNIGGRSGWPKLQAARQLGLPVLMIRRPKGAEIERRADAASAVEWLDETVGLELKAEQT
ncbi:MAG: precorrin-6A/cobalt-precorrin-6A reductase [Pseudomonadota bacterium]